jgi:protein NrfC
MAGHEKPESKKKKIGRREFLIGSGSALAAGALAAGIPASVGASSDKADHPESKAYLVYDSRVCWGCQSCMFACSSAHYGEANPSLSRIQIIRDAPSFTTYPNDIVMAVCRQCVTPVCVENCPVGAAHIDTENGNVRRIDEEKCIGCGTCLEMCPQQPHRTVWNPILGKSTKCDLCIDTPYWNKKGGPGGEPACVTICPAKALKLVSEAPPQGDVKGYDVDMAPPPPAFPRRRAEGSDATDSAPKS